jgi:uncharacterized repeat protein (TIGR01451 family)
MGFVTAHRRAARTRHGRPPALVATALGLACLAATVGAPIAEAAPSAPSAPAAPAAITASGPFAATGEASLATLTIPSLSPALLPQTNVDLAHSTARADSAADLDAAKDADQRTDALAATTGESSLLGSPLEIQETYASAPPSEAFDDVAIPVPASPLLDLEVIRTTALANWISDTECVASDTPLSLADQALADLTLLSPEEGQSVAELDTTDDDGAVDTEAVTQLVSIPGDNDPRAVQARATTNVTDVNVLNNIAPDLASVIEAVVVQAPDWTATASGLPGGATVTGPQPVVEVNLGGEQLVTLDEYNETVEATITDLVLGDLINVDSITILDDLLTDLGLDALIPVVEPIEGGVRDLLNALQPIIRLSMPVEIVEEPDGTRAFVQSSLLRIEILPPEAVGGTDPIADAVNQILAALGADTSGSLLQLDLAPTTAEAIAPLGGITCGADNNPLELQKVHSGPAIPGSSFDYTIAVGNVGDCAMDPVRVVDTLTGPAGSTIALTEPSATVTDQGGGTFQIVWDNVGPIPPDGRVSLRIRVNVPADATVGDRYSDTVTSTASIVPGEGCTARDVTRTVTLDEPAVIGARSGPCNITGSRKGKSHLEVYPGESFIYFINILNSGGEPCTGVTVVDPIDSRLTFESCSDGCTFSAPNATWNLGTLAPGQSVTLRLQVKVNQGATGTLENTGTIDTNETGPSTVHVDGPLISDTSVLSGNTPAVVPDQTLARTGGLASWPVALTLGLLAFGAWHLRRRWAPVTQP